MHAHGKSPLIVGCPRSTAVVLQSPGHLFRMIVFINFGNGGNPLHALGVLLLCCAFNVAFDFLTSSPGQFVWLELAVAGLGLVATGLLLAVVIKMFFGPAAGHARVQHVLSGLFGFMPPAAGQGGHPRARHQQSAQQRQQRWHKLVQTLQRLPTETVATQQELEQLTSHELKERLVATGSSCAGCLERQELIEALLQAGGSSGSSCCICCEDYASGDVVRVLPCKHRFHIECVDKWFLTSEDFSRTPACPMCNAELI